MGQCETRSGIERRRRAVGSVLLTLCFATSACTPTAAPNPSVSSSVRTGVADATATPSMACEILKVDASSAPKAGSLTITVAQRTRIHRKKVQKNDVLLNEAVTPHIKWSASGAPTDADVFEWLSTEGATDAMTGVSPGIDRVSKFAAGLSKKDGTYIGYAGVQRIAQSLTVGCLDGRILSGSLETWTDSEVGAIKCGLRQDDKAPPMSRKVQRQFC